jgi:hypothetical protein
MTDTIIRVEHLGKRYRIGARQQSDHGWRSLGSLISAPFSYLRGALREPLADEAIWALKDVSFEACPEPVEGSSAARWWAFLRQPFDGAQDKAQDRFWPQWGGEDDAHFDQVQCKAQDPLPHHRADGRPRRVMVAGVQGHLSSVI